MIMREYSMEELLPIVARLAKQYTRNESTSITYEKAKQLMVAIEYCINEGKQDISRSVSPMELKKEEKDITAKEAYEIGYQLVLKKVNKVRTDYNQLIIEFRDYGNQNYHDTIVLGIPKFIQYYDAKFEPQNTILTLDYPTIIPIEQQCGVHAIHQYLEYVKLEQEFLKNMPGEYIEQVLERYQSDYKNMYFNICNIISRNILTCMAIEKSILQINFSKQEIDSVKQYVEGKKKEELFQELSKLLRVLIAQKYNKNQRLYNYLNYDIKDFSIELINGSKYNCIEKIFKTDL